MVATPKKRQFANGLLDGLNPSDSYRLAYNTSNMLPLTVNNEAYKLTLDPDVSTMVAAGKEAITDAIIAKRAWDLDTIIDEYSVNVYGAREDKQWSASNAAITGIGKALGILTDKVDINVTHTLKPGLSLEELEARIQRLNALEARVIEGVGEVEELDN